MRIVSVDQVWEHLQKRLALDDSHKKKEAIAKKPKVAGLFVKAPLAITRAPTL